MERDARTASLARKRPRGVRRMGLRSARDGWIAMVDIILSSYFEHFLERALRAGILFERLF
jgi:hypothetical protein